MVKRPRRQPGSPTLRDEPSQAPQEAPMPLKMPKRHQLPQEASMLFKKWQWLIKCQKGASVIFINDKTYQTPKRASVYCVNIKWSYTNSPARNSKWWAERDEEPLSLSQANRAHQASSKYNTVLWSNQTKTGSNALIFKRTSTIRRGIRTNNKALTFPMQSVLQKVHHVRNNELIFMYDTQRKAKQTFTWFFLAQISQIPTTSKETGQSKLFWWICKTLFLYIFYFPQPLLVAEDSPKFFTWYVERCLFQGSRHNTDTPTALMLTKCVN